MNTTPTEGIVPVGTALVVAPLSAEQVVIHAQGRFRRGMVVKRGPKRTTVFYTTHPLRQGREKAVQHEQVFQVAEEGDEPVGVIVQPTSQYQRHAGGHYLGEA